MNIKGMYVDNLILEVTRRCNMRCDHCLRGDAQNLDMTHEIIDKVIDTFQGFGTVSFTGGEPTLNIDAIRYFFKKAEEKDKLPCGFFVATNGKVNQEELAILLLQYFPKMEAEACEVALSIDNYHEYTEIETPSILRGLSFYSDCKEHRSDGAYLDQIIPEGRGAAISMSNIQRESENLYVDEGNIEQLYVAANGNVVGCCDFSFEHIDELAVTNIMETTEVEDE